MRGLNLSKELGWKESRSLSEIITEMNDLAPKQEG